MTINNHHDIANYYDVLLKKHRTGPLAVDWNTEEAQELLFIALMDGLDEDALYNGASVLDIGCGLGALYWFLTTRGYQVDYTGYDLSQHMVTEAKRRYPSCHFTVRDILIDPPSPQSFDFVFLSGSISLKLPDHERYVRKIIKRMFQTARCSVSFNLLSSWSLPLGRAFQVDHLRYYPSPNDILAFCQSLSPLVSLRHDAATWTFTVQLHRRGSTLPRVSRRFEAHVRAQPPSGARDIKLINQYLDNGDIAACLGVIGDPGNDADMWNYRAVCHSHRQESNEERAALQRALELNPRHPWACFNMGTSELKARRYDSALQWYKSAVELDPENDMAREQLINLHIRFGQIERAKDLLPGFSCPAQQAFMSGKIHLAAGARTSAKRCLREALRHAPAFLDAWRKLATLAEQQGEDKAAARAWQRLLDLHPFDRQALKALTTNHLRNGHFRRAYRLLENVVFDSELDFIRARAAVQLGWRHRALDALDDVLIEEPEHEAARHLQRELTEDSNRGAGEAK